MTRRNFMDFSLIQLERALLARAEQIETWGLDGENDPVVIVVKKVLAAELRALAEELHEDGRP